MKLWNRHVTCTELLFPLSAVPSCSLIIAVKLVKPVHQAMNGGAHLNPNVGRYISHALHYLQLRLPCTSLLLTTFCSRTSRFSHFFFFYLLSTVTFITHSVCFAFLISPMFFYHSLKLMLSTKSFTRLVHIVKQSTFFTFTKLMR